MMQKSEAYWPIEVGREVIYPFPDGHVELKQILHVFDDNHLTLSRDTGLPEQWVDGRVSMDILALKPRERVNVRAEDKSHPMGEFKAQKFRSDFKMIANTEIWDERAVEFYNTFMDRIRRELIKQGISVSRVVSRVDLVDLRINGVHDNGNREVRHYMRQLERHNVRELIVSIIDNIHYNTEAFHNLHESKVVLGLEPILSMLKHERGNLDIMRIIQHQMFAVRRGTGRMSVFDLAFDARNATKNLYGKTKGKGMLMGQTMALEEVYIHASDIAYLAREIRRTKETSFIRPLREKARVLADISLNSHRILSDILDNFHGPKGSFANGNMNQGGFFIISDTSNRRVFVILPGEAVQLVDGSDNLWSILSSLSPSEISAMRRSLKQFSLETRNRMASHLQFFQDNPNPTTQALMNYQHQIEGSGGNILELQFIQRMAMRYRLEESFPAIKEEIEARLTKAKELTLNVHKQAQVIYDSLLMDEAVHPISQEIQKLLFIVRRDSRL